MRDGLVPVAGRRGVVERALVSLIILISVGLSLTWAFAVPMFQEPDEDQHADYAFAIFSTGHLIGARDGTPAIDSNPLVRYMLGPSGFRAMRYNVVGRAPSGYGSPDFFRQFDAGAPTVPKDYIARGREIPNLVTAYPFLYYALDALSIATGAAITHGSAAGEFFFARAFSVALLAVSLVFIYLTLCEMRLALGLRLAILAIVGWFPLTTWVSAYIQPDNLALTAVSATLFLTLRLRRRPESRSLTVALALMLGVLWLTKIQYFVAVAPAAVLCVVFGQRLTRSDLGRRAAFGLALLIPTFAAIALTRFIAFSATSSVSGFAGSFGTDFATARAGGIGSTAAYFGRELLAAYENAFSLGTGVYTYWLDFNWLNTPILRNPWGSTVPLAYAVVISSTILSILVFVRIISVLRRLTNVATKHSTSVALRLFFSDVVLNSYLAFVAIMFAIFVLSDGTLAQYGRYWLPFEMAAVLCVVRYAPQVFPRRVRGALSTAMTVVLLAYSTASAIAGPSTLQARFYRPALQADRTTESIAAIDRVNGSLIPVPIILNGAVHVPAGKDVLVGGWAIDSRSGEPAKRVDLVVDGSYVFPTEYGLLSCNKLLEIAFYDPELFRCGFQVKVAGERLVPGSHLLSLLVYERNRDEPYPSSNKLRIEADPR